MRPANSVSVDSVRFVDRKVAMKIPTILLGMILLLVAACGSADGESASSDDGAPTEVSVFTSTDGVVNVVVPEGAAPTSFVGSAERSDASAIGIDLETDQGVVLVYELGTSGTIFNEPVQVTFRIPPDLGGFDPNLGVPLGVLMIADGDGGFQTLSDSQASLDGETLVLEGATSHFSDVVAFISDGSITLEVGAQYEVGVPFRPKVVISSRDPLDYGITWTAVNDRISVQGASTYEANATCETVGPDTLQAKVFLEDSALVFVAVAFTFNPEPDGHETFFYVRADVECVEPPDSGIASEEDTASSVGHNDDAVGDQNDMSNSTPVAEGEGEPGADITHVEYVAGDEGVACFDIDTAGDGQTASAEAPNYDITIEVIDSEGEQWQARVKYRFGEPNSGVVWLGPKTSGRPTVEGGTATVEWLDSDTVQLCVNGGGTDLGVKSFLIKIDFFGTEGNFYDSAEGAVE